MGEQGSASIKYGAVNETLHPGNKPPRPEQDTSARSNSSDSRKHAGDVKLAMAMFLGLLIDGIPEAILLGFLAAKKELSYVLVISLFLANFPEALSSSSLMAEASVKPTYITGMWCGLCLMTGILCALACEFMLFINVEGGSHASLGIQMIVSCVEGLAGGAMICCISSVMLPEAYERRNKHFRLLSPGFLTASGFLSAVALKVFGGGVHDNPFEGQHTGHQFFAESIDFAEHGVDLLLNRMLRR